jgi:hypothetical protein
MIEVDRDQLAEIEKFEHEAAEIEALIERTDQGIARIQGQRAPAVVTAADLQCMVFPRPRWAIPGLIPEGMTLFCGSPKIGKSRLALQLACALAFGGTALSFTEVAQGGALVLSLEDGPRRLQERIAALLGDESSSWPEDLVFATEWPRLGEGGEEALDAFLTAHPHTRLVVVDVFQMLRPSTSARENAYAADYNSMRMLKQISDRHRIALVAVHHTRKLAADDPLSLVSGTNGLAGAVDSVLILQREPNGGDATLYLRGRDVEETQFTLAYARESGAWAIAGGARSEPLSQTREAIVDALEKAWPGPMTPKAIATAAGLSDGTVRQRLLHLEQAGTIRRVQRGLYTVNEPPTPIVTTPVRDPHNSRNDRNNGENARNEAEIDPADCYGGCYDPAEAITIENSHNRAENYPIGTVVTAVTGGQHNDDFGRGGDCERSRTDVCD